MAFASPLALSAGLSVDFEGVLPEGCDFASMIDDQDLVGKVEEEIPRR